MRDAEKALEWSKRKDRSPERKGLSVLSIKFVCIAFKRKKQKMVRKTVVRFNVQRTKREQSENWQRKR